MTKASKSPDVEIGVDRDLAHVVEESFTRRSTFSVLAGFFVPLFSGRRNQEDTTLLALPPGKFDRQSVRNGPIWGRAQGTPTGEGSQPNAFRQSGSAATIRTLEDKARDVLHLADYLPQGYVTDGSIDYTAQWQQAVNDASLIARSRKLIVPRGIWKTTSTLDLKNKSIILEGEGYLHRAPTIRGEFDGFIFDLSGTPSAYGEPSLLIGLKIQNAHNGSAPGSAGCLDLRYTGLVRLQDCEVQAQNTGLLMGETISLTLDNICVIGDSATNPKHTYSRGLQGGARNFKMFGGRIFGCFIAADISGDSLSFYGTNMEFNDILFRTGALSTLLASSCHFETSGMILTNALTLPTITPSRWTDHGSEGIGWAGAITFLNCHVAFNAVGRPNGVAAPAFVIKSQKSFGANLNLTGCSFAIPNNLATVSQSFDRSAATSIPSGMSVVISGTTGMVRPTSTPSDSYTSWADLTTGGGASFGSVRIARIAGNVAGDGGQLAGFSKLGLNDQSSYIDLSDGMVVNGYTSASLRSTYYGKGVRMKWPAFTPTHDNTATLGTPSLRWSTIYAANGVIHTSDATAKTDVQPTALGLDFINALLPKRYRMRESGNLTLGDEEEFADEQGVLRRRIKPGSQVPLPGKRYHEGLIAQDVKATLDDIGIDSALWTKDDQGGQGLRYEELIGPLIKAVQELSTRIESLEAKTRI